ncbi:hypothetical protein [Actinomyces mediterranea]|uniref:hypothetical protein n=1 Tax=Actinomyces mediterranea TaxID=1871028 RepID=UPI0009711E9C|nr:hypothetical protein [Actinomyces mediterranea]
MSDFKPFHSAVNRVPIPRASVLDYVERGVLPSDVFGDETPTGHDRLRPDRWSGSLDVEMTVRTPLVFGEQTEDDEGRPTVEVPIDAVGHPIVPGTMVKGMISRAYELFTASRFRVFGDHDEVLTYRADPAGALGLLPGRICEYEGGLGVEILDGFGRTGPVSAQIKDDCGSGNDVSVVCEGHPRIMTMKGIRPQPEQVLARFRSLTRHGVEAEVQLSRWREDKGPEHLEDKGPEHLEDKGPEHLMVTGVWVDDQMEEFFRVPPQLNPTTLNVWGYPCRTSPEKKHASDLFSDKKYERFFFKTDHMSESLDGVVLSLSQDHIDRYDAVIRSYREQHDLPGGDAHLLNRAALEDSKLVPGTLVFVHLDRDSSQHGTPSRTDQIVDVYPTMVGRRSYRMSPRALAKAQRVLPVSHADEASPADRLFGYVVGDAPSGARGGDVSSKGRLLFGTVDTDEVKLSTEPRRLAPLLSPKLSSARRFLTTRRGATPTQEKDQLLPRSEYFSEGQLLGAATYPVHRELLNSQSFPEEIIQNTKVDQSNDKVRMTAKSWIAPGSILRCRIRFEDLTSNELSVLVWVLTPENLVPDSEKDAGRVGYLRMGLGKPYGLGALEVRLAEDGLHAVRGGGDSGLAAMYRDLSGCLGTAEHVHPATDFILHKEKTLLKTPWIQALQRAAFGYSDGVPVRYMSLEENKANNRTDPKTGFPQTDCGVSPQDLFGTDATKPLEIPKGSPKRKKH